jgi:hypothetical protein
MSIVTTSRGSGISAVQATEALVTLVTSVGEWVTTVQTEGTKRAQIHAWEVTQLQRIQAQRDIVLTYLEGSFRERAVAFEALFESLDKALARGPEETSAVLTSITDLAAHSPFAGLKDAGEVLAALHNPDFEWVV